MRPPTVSIVRQTDHRYRIILRNPTNSRATARLFSDLKEVGKSITVGHIECLSDDSWAFVVTPTRKATRALRHTNVRRRIFRFIEAKALESVPEL